MDTQAFLRQGLQRGYIDVRGLERRSDEVRALHRAEWEPIYKGLWVPDPEVVPHNTGCRLVLEHLGDTAHVTADSALFLLGVMRTEPDAVHILRPADAWLRPRDGLCVHYAQDFTSVRTMTRDGVRLTWGARSIAEHARHGSPTPFIRTVAAAVQGRVCTLGHLRDELARARFPGRVLLRRAVESLQDDHSHSGAERLGRKLLAGAGVMVPGKPLPVLAGTVPVAEVDIPFFEVGYGVEIDGPHHLLAEQAARDRARDRMLYRDHGITIDRYFWFELEDEPDRFVREVTAELRRRGASIHPP